MDELTFEQLSLYYEEDGGCVNEVQEGVAEIQRAYRLKHGLPDESPTV